MAIQGAISCPRFLGYFWAKLWIIWWHVWLSQFELANTDRDTVLEFKQRASKVFRPVEAAMHEAQKSSRTHSPFTSPTLQNISWTFTDIWCGNVKCFAEKSSILSHHDPWSRALPFSSLVNPLPQCLSCPQVMHILHFWQFNVHQLALKRFMGRKVRNNSYSGQKHLCLFREEGNMASVSRGQKTGVWLYCPQANWVFQPILDLSWTSISKYLFSRYSSWAYCFKL